MVVLQKFLDGMEKYMSGPSLQNINHAMNIVRIIIVFNVKNVDLITRA